jgi:transposase
VQAGVEHSDLSQVVPRELYEKLQQESSQKIMYLEHQIAELRRLIYGARSERFVSENKDQLHLFDVEASDKGQESTETITYQRKKKKLENPPVRLPLPAHLPRVEEIIDPENLPEGARKIGEEVTEVLEYNPANIFVRKVVRPKYAAGDTIHIANLPSLPLPKSNAGASMLAHIAVSKFVDHLPFYRQRQIFKRQQLDISDSTLGGWFAATARLLEPLYHELHDQAMAGDYLQMDESPIGVQDSHKQGALHTGYQWVVHNPVKRLVLFKYARGRTGNTPEELLEGFGGTLQTDGYNVYRKQAKKQNFTLLGCMSHGRRYFEKALDNDKPRATHAMEHIQKLYRMERKAKLRNASVETIRRYRQMYALPILNALEQWMKDQLTHVLPKSAISKAIAYNLGVWENIKRYTSDGRYHIDNNLIENSIRPLALGRKNYLFAGSHQSAQHIAMFYSFFATCKINQIEPLAWLTGVLNKIADTKMTELHTLLPINS